MLLALEIHEFAIIERLSVRFGPGLTALTGETGAGKSIIVDALSALLGARMGGDYMRAGARAARVEGLFALPRDPASHERAVELLASHGVEPDDDTLAVAREWLAGGRSLARLGGRVVPLSALQQLGALLVDIHSQSEHVSLLRPGEQLRLLDAYACVGGSLAVYRSALDELYEVQHAVAALSGDERELARRVDLLRFQVNEIDAASLTPGEEDELRRERTLLANAERLAAAADAAYRALHGGERQAGVVDLLGRAAAAARDVASIDGAMAEPLAQLEDIQAQVGEVTRTFRQYRDGVEVSPRRLEQIEERLEAIRMLGRKYGPSVEAVLAYRERSAGELADMDGAEERLAALREQEAALMARAGALAGDLSRQRRAASERLAQAAQRELVDLGLEHAHLAVRVAQRGAADGLPIPEALRPPDAPERWAWDASGCDQVELLFSANPGEPPKPLGRVASGGELARTMLALKTALKAEDPVPTLVFDEIETGVGGRSGQVVGAKLRELAERHQVICITHLPTVAAFADQHHRATKHVVGDRAVARLELLDRRARLDELAAMLGGAGEAARRAADELLEQARGDAERLPR
ncbi:MAG: DNA repair protein RecN [Chloroflexi bacterium]|nr:DNA repair protein RecN [Chloroflexota bacterium]